MPTTFITGSSGFVGATILDRLLASKYKVVGAFRSQSSASKLFSVNPHWDQSLITVVEIPDFSKPDAFDAVFKDHPDIDSVIHVAAAGLSGPTTDFVEHFEKPTVHGQLSLLESVHKYGKNVKAISVTGSINAITTGAQDDIKSRAITSSEWLPMGRKEALEMQHPFVRRTPSHFRRIVLIQASRYHTASQRSSLRKPSGISLRRRTRISL
jgi:nucleoside-diphosphate-sugar epimerase